MTGTALSVRGGGMLSVDDERTQAYRTAVLQAAADKAEADKPDSTRRAFRQDWSLWTEFIDGQNAAHGIALDYVADVTSAQLVAYVGWLDTVKRASPTSMPRRLTGIRAHLRDVHDVRPEAAVFAAARKAIRALTAASGSADGQAQKAARAERKSRARGQAPALTKDRIRDMAEAASDDLLGLKQRALVCLAYACAARAAEMSALLYVDVTPVTVKEADGSDSYGLDVDVPPVKGGDGRKVFVPATGGPACPWAAWNVWAAVLRDAGLSEGAAFPVFGRAGRPLSKPSSAESCRLTLASLAEAAGLTDASGEPLRVTGHSARRGYITSARAAGVPVERIAAQSGHSLKSPEFWGYIEEADRYQNAYRAN